MSRSLQEHQYDVCGQRIRLLVPENPDAILAEAVEGCSSDPYWGKVWDSAPYAAACVINSQWLPGSRALELGCGCGLMGIAALFAGLRVTFSDHEAEAVGLAVKNARLNRFENAAGMIVDWHDPPKENFDVLLASDVLYEERHHLPLLAAANKLIAEQGGFYIGDPGRRLAGSFLKLANQAGWRTEIFDLDLQPVLLPAINEFQWLVLRR